PTTTPHISSPIDLGDPLTHLSPQPNFAPEFQHAPSTYVSAPEVQHEIPVFNSASEPAVRKSTRISQPPSYLADYHCNLPSKSCSNVSSVEPKTFTQANKSECWKEAMATELHALAKNNTWSVVTLPSGKVPIGCKWVYKVKYHVNGSIE
ncbi:hypothetical protein A2U01_0037649, partial [Trifolium medium]|nr:hypothetical protein [Trifolium medium]